MARHRAELRRLDNRRFPGFRPTVFTSLILRVHLIPAFNFADSHSNFLYSFDNLSMSPFFLDSSPALVVISVLS